jgi:hypothetical protein
MAFRKNRADLSRAPFSLLSCGAENVHDIDLVLPCVHDVAHVRVALHAQPDHGDFERLDCADIVLGVEHEEIHFRSSVVFRENLVILLNLVRLKAFRRKATYRVADIVRVFSSPRCCQREYVNANVVSATIDLEERIDTVPNDAPTVLELLYRQFKWPVGNERRHTADVWLASRANPLRKPKSARPRGFQKPRKPVKLYPRMPANQDDVVKATFDISRAAKKRLADLKNDLKYVRSVPATEKSIVEILIEQADPAALAQALRRKAKRAR